MIDQDATRQQETAKDRLNCQRYPEIARQAKIDKDRPRKTKIIQNRPRENGWIKFKIVQNLLESCTLALL